MRLYWLQLLILSMVETLALTLAQAVGCYIPPTQRLIRVVQAYWQLTILNNTTRHLAVLLQVLAMALFIAWRQRLPPQCQAAQQKLMMAQLPPQLVVWR